MAIRFVKASTQRLTAPDAAAAAFPNSDWCFGFFLGVVGATTTADAQYVISTAPYMTAGGFNVVYRLNATVDSTPPLGSVEVYLNGASTPSPLYSPAHLSGWRLFVVQRSGNVAYLKSVGIQTTEPTDGSAVTTHNSTALTAAMDGTQFYIGDRADNTRQFNHALTRMFKADVALTDLQIAQLAYGKQPSELGVTPSWRIRMDDASDYADQAGALTVTAVNSPTTYAQPAFGYGATAPTITGAPTIVGTPTNGAVSSYTPAPVTGSPTPNRTQQWTLDGVDSSNAATYTPGLGDVGKALALRQIETNASGTASATSDPVTVVAATVGISATDLTANRIWQRQSGAASVAFAGAYIGAAPASVEVQLYASDGTTVLQAWAAVSSLAAASGSWSGSLSVPAGGMYLFAVRSKDGGGTVLATGPVSANLWGVGDLLVMMGSSSPHYWGTADSGTFTPAATVRRFNELNTWQPAGTGGVIITLCNAYTAAFGVPVAFIEAGVGGSKLSDWAYPPSTVYQALLADLTAVGGKVAAVLMHAGSNDAAAGTVASKAAHIALYQTLISNMRAVTGQAALPFFISGANRRPGADDAQFTLVREAEKDMGQQTGCYYTQTIDVEVSGDNIHPGPTGYRSVMDRMSADVLAVFGGTARKISPRITAIATTSTGATITVDAGSGTDITPSSAITGFSATDDSGALALSAAVRTNASTITLTFGRTAVGTPVVKYLYGANPIATGGGVFGNTTPALPMDLETEGLGVGVDLAAAATASATGGATLLKGVSLAGAALSVASSTAGMSHAVPLAAAATGTASGTGQVSLSITFEAHAIAQALATAALNVSAGGSAVNLAAAGGAQATGTATLALAVNLSAVALAQAASSAAFGGAATLATQAIANAQASAAMAVGKPITAAGQGQAGAGATLWLQVPLVAAALAQAAGGGAMGLVVTLAASALGQAGSSANLPMAVTLAADGAAVAMAGAALQVTGPVVGAAAMVARERRRVWAARERRRAWTSRRV